MKGIFSAVTFIAIATALVAGSPIEGTKQGQFKHSKRGQSLAERNGALIYTKAADFIHITSEASPDVDQDSIFGTQTGLIARTNGQNEFDSYVSFYIPALSTIPGASASSTCNLVIRNPASTYGSQITQAFTLGAEFGPNDVLTFNQHPFVNQYEGAYLTELNSDSTAIDVA